MSNTPVVKINIAYQNVSPRAAYFAKRNIRDDRSFLPIQYWIGGADIVSFIKLDSISEGRSEKELVNDIIRETTRDESEFPNIVWSASDTTGQFITHVIRGLVGRDAIPSDIDLVIIDVVRLLGNVSIESVDAILVSIDTPDDVPSITVYMK